MHEDWIIDCCGGQKSVVCCPLRSDLVTKLFGSLSAAAQSVAIGSADTERDRFIQQMMKSAGIPGVQAVVVKGNRILWSKSYGYAVLAQLGPVTPMRNDSILFTCSVAKILTAVAVMQQVEKGSISLDDDINRYVPFMVRNPKWPDVPITWRMLLTHTSSINDATGVEESVYTYGMQNPVTLEAYLEGIFKPGGIYQRPDSYLAISYWREAVKGLRSILWMEARRSPSMESRRMNFPYSGLYRDLKFTCGITVFRLTSS